jgi:hypothetical protein
VPPKLFTVSEANALLPTLAPLVERIVEAQRAFRASEQLLDAFRTRATMEGGVLPDQDLSQAKADVDRLQAEIQGLAGEVEALGCIVKDLDRGLVDFLSLRKGAHVFLCWHAGESAIRFWHGLEEGFSGRMPIDMEG